MTDSSFWFAVVGMVGCGVMFLMSAFVISGAVSAENENTGWILGFLAFLGFCFFGMNL